MVTKTASQATLKPCPHCGNTNLNGPHLTDYVGDTHQPSWWVECSECPAHMQVDGEGPEPTDLDGDIKGGSPKTEPDPTLLRSMAMRYRHDFGLLDPKHQAAILVQMRQLWEEVVGLGFYRLHNH